MRKVTVKRLRTIALRQYGFLEIRKRREIPFKRFFKWIKRIYNMGELKLA